MMIINMLQYFINVAFRLITKNKYDRNIWGEGEASQYLAITQYHYYFLCVLNLNAVHLLIKLEGIFVKIVSSLTLFFCL